MSKDLANMLGFRVQAKFLTKESIENAYLVLFVPGIFLNYRKCFGVTLSVYSWLFMYSLV